MNNQDNQTFGRCRLVLAEAIITTDANGIVNSYSNGAERLFGYLPPEVIGKPVGNFFKGSQPELESIGHLLKGQDTVHTFSVEVVGKNRRTIPAQLLVSLLKEDGGGCNGVIIICRDLNRLGSIGKEIPSKDQFMEALISSFVEAVLVLDSKRRIASSNEAAQAVLGYAEEEMLGLPLDLLIPQDVRTQEELQKISPVALAQNGSESYQTQLVTKDGRIVDAIIESAGAGKPAVPTLELSPEEIY